MNEQELELLKSCREELDLLILLLETGVDRNRVFDLNIDVLTKLKEYDL